MYFKVFNLINFISIPNVKVDSFKATEKFKRTTLRKNNQDPIYPVGYLLKQENFCNKTSCYRILAQQQQYQPHHLSSQKWLTYVLTSKPRESEYINSTNFMGAKL